MSRFVDVRGRYINTDLVRSFWQTKDGVLHVELSITFYHGEGGLTMTNEELARQIQQGERDLLLQLWEQVRRYAHDRA